MSELERLREVLASKYKRNDYLNFRDLLASLEQASHPPGSQSHDYPRMLYGPNGEQRIVQNAEEESAAIAEDFSRTPPAHDSTYPRRYTERGDLGHEPRTVILHDADEEELWWQLESRDNWMGDPHHYFGGRPTSMAARVEKERQSYHKTVDEMKPRELVSEGKEETVITDNGEEATT